MKTGIFAVLAALALAVFAVPDAHAGRGHFRGPDVDQRVFGSSFVIGVDDGNTTASVNLLAKGQPGTAQANGLIVFGPPLGMDLTRCPEDFPFASDLISLDFVETYKDGSLLIGAADEFQAVCSNGVTNLAKVVGSITRGTGRFEGVGGRWELEASSPAGPDAGTTGTFTVDFD